jgi:hypothetical protein
VEFKSSESPTCRFERQPQGFTLVNFLSRVPLLLISITNPAFRPELLRQGSRDVGKVFVVAAVLDAVYQLIVQCGVFLLELLVWMAQIA